jgi:hypothetical protein
MGPANPPPTRAATSRETGGVHGVRTAPVHGPAGGPVPEQQYRRREQRHGRADDQEEHAGAVGVEDREQDEGERGGALSFDTKFARPLESPWKRVGTARWAAGVLAAGFGYFAPAA